MKVSVLHFDSLTFFALFFFLCQVAATKGNEKIAEWSDAIINHFWYCCSVASECNDKVNATAVLKVMLSTIIKSFGTYVPFNKILSKESHV